MRNSMKVFVKKYMSSSLLIVVTLLFAGQSLAADKKTEAAGTSSTMPIDVIADRGSYDQLAGIAIYEGNVKVTQGVATIWSDKITITLKNNAAERLEATGKPVKFEYKGEKQPIYGQGNQITYQVTNKIVSMLGNAEIKQGKDVIKGAKLTYNLDKEIIGGSRVKMTFLPSQSK